ncbi:MAG: GDSL-type esterase/lipase family protein, partial [Leucothrix sp.]
MIKTLYAFVWVLAASLLLITGEVAAKQSNNQATATQASEKISVLVWGDSLSAAYGIPQEKGWVSLLQQQFDEQLHVVNASISGETTQGGLSRLPDALVRYKPSLLLLELGANDGLRGIQTEVMQENLQKMIEMSRDANAQVVLLGIRI